MRVFVRSQKANKTYMNIEQYASWCGISKDTVIRRINRGILRVYQPEKRGRVLIELDNEEPTAKPKSSLSNFAMEFATRR